MSKVLHDAYHDNAKATAIPQVFSENSQANKVLRTKSVTKKEMNECMAEIMILAGFEPGPPG